VGYLIFLSINAHHIILNAIASSFQLIPPLGFEFSAELVNIYMNIVRDVFVISVKIAAPLIATLLFTSVALGMIARTVPQMNVFIVGFPLQIGLGLLMIGLTLPLFGMVINNIAGLIEQNIFALLKAM
jgi:flagellar biosynthetic protein FliR